MSSPQLEILYEDNHLLAVNKPANLPTMGVSEADPSLWRQACDYLRHKYHKPGNVYLGVVSRLDSLVSGVVIFARTSKAAARLNEQFRNRDVTKTYWALIEGRLNSAAGSLHDWVAKNERQQRMELVSADAPGALDARLNYRRLAELPGRTLLEVQLETGRKHQIRVQFAGQGHPIVGDQKYGSRGRFPQGIALHGRRLQLVHPTTKAAIILAAPLPRCWPEAVLAIDER